MSAGLDTIESESHGLRARFGSRAAGRRRARCELQLCCVGSRRVAAVSRAFLFAPCRRLRARNAQTTMNKQQRTQVAVRARRVATRGQAVRAVFADADLREADDARRGGAARTGPRRRLTSAARGVAASTPTFWARSRRRRATRPSRPTSTARRGWARPRAARNASRSRPAPPWASPRPRRPRRRRRRRRKPYNRRHRRGAAASGAPTRASRRGARPGRGTRGGGRTNRGRGGLARVRRPRVAAAKKPSGVRERLRRNRRPVLRLARALVDERPAAVVVGEGVGGSSRLRGRLARATARRRRAPRRVSRRVFCCGRRRVRRTSRLAVLRAVCVK